MKNKNVLSISLFALTLSLVGCGSKTMPPHEHTWSDPTYTWSNDYSICTAMRVCLQDENHTEGETQISTYSILTEPGCETDGQGKFVVSFDNPAFETQTHVVTLEATGHDWGTPTYEWNADYTQCTATMVCSNDSSHIKTETVDSVYSVIIPQCDGGLGRYTATFTNAAFETQTHDVTLEATGHDWGTPTYTWANDYSSCTARRVCNNDSSHIQTETVASTYAVVTEPTEENEGLGRYTATFANEAFEVQTQDVSIEKIMYYGQYPKISEDGRTITYGLYPQTNVDDSSLVSALNDLTTPESNGWYLYNNEYYAKLSAKPNSSSYKFDNGTTIVNGTTYWFKCEPIVWNVLSNNSGEYYILSSVILDAHCYYTNTSDRTVSGSTVYANNYQYSDIRAWLNNDFYNSAFALGNSHIQTTTIDNSASTTDSSSNPYACDNTQDKVFLPSYKDYINSSYGFSTSADSTDTARYCRTTDYARANGAYYYTSSGYYQYNGYYWIRSPYRDYSGGAWFVRVDGLLDFNEVGITSYSVRPGLSIRIA